MEIFQCFLCPVLFQSKDGIKKHIELFHLLLRHKCKECEAKFVTEANLKEHTKKVHQKPGSEFLTQIDHEVRPQALKMTRNTYTCNLCFLMFRGKYSFQQHFRDHHQDIKCK